MLKRRRGGPGNPIWYDNWPLARPPELVGSSAARRFEDALRRFVNGQLSGRSFLIAGHRGAGKTTMVTAAVERLTHEIFASLTQETTLGFEGDSLAAVPQRPLLVRVHGPSLILDELPGPGAGEGGAARQDAGKGAAKADGAAPDVDESDEAAVKPPKKQSILVQLTTALYRALARECAGAFAIHARSMRGADAAEVAAQLQLALDEAPDPALLRAFWQKFDVLDRGVFFPRAVARSLAGAGLAGQGLREIVAVATTAQIFEVSAGKVVFSRVKKDSSKVDQEAGKAGTEAWSETLKKLFGFSAGAVLGGGAAYGLDLGGTGSLVAGLVGGLASGFTSNLTRTREDTLDYRVMLDRSAASLERDLPLAIERIRAAGFAPVFLIDELDKLDGGKNDIESTMRELIFQMKQLTTDYGFFCFLVDRGYFDRVQALVEREAYAIEHSFFSERLYVLPAPEDLQDYVLKQFEADQPNATTPERVNPLVVAKHLVHQSKLNMLDLIRQLDATDDFEHNSILGGLRYRLTAAIQMGVERVLAEPELSARSAQDISFRQSLTDVLYIISRAWERDEPEVDLGDNVVATRLMERMYPTNEVGKTPNPSDKKGELEARIGKRDADLLTGAVRRLAGLLCDVDNLNGKLLPGGSTGSGLPINGTVRIEPALLTKSPGNADLQAPPTWIYTFQYDQFGRQFTDREGILLEADEIKDALQLTNSSVLFQSPGFAAGVPIDILIASGLWPPDLAPSIVLAACANIGDVYNTRLGYSGFSREKVMLARVRDMFDQNLSGMGAILHVAFALERDACVGSAMALQRIRLVLDFSQIMQNSFSQSPASLISVSQLPTGPSQPRPTRQDIEQNPVKIAGWFQGIRNEAFSLTQHLPDPTGIWMRRASRLVRLFGLPNASPFPDPLDYDDLIVVARDVLPAPLLRRDLSTPESVTTAEWSVFALEALTTLTSPADSSEPNTIAVPAWMAVPSLFALGFGSSMLTIIAKMATSFAQNQVDGLPLSGRPRVPVLPVPAEALRLISELPPKASPSDPQGFLFILADEAFPTDFGPRQPGQPPVFLMRASHVSRYATARALLTELNAFQGTIDERT